MWFCWWCFILCVVLTCWKGLSWIEVVFLIGCISVKIYLVFIRVRRFDWFVGFLFLCDVICVLGIFCDLVMVMVCWDYWVIVEIFLEFLRCWGYVVRVEIWVWGWSRGIFLREWYVCCKRLCFMSNFWYECMCWVLL